jgi:hypothetical protein
MYFLLLYTYGIQAITRPIEADGWLETPGPHRSERVLRERICHGQTRCTIKTSLNAGRICRDTS